MSYSTVSKTYLESTIDTRLYKYIVDPCYNLSAILGDVDGYIPSNVARKLELLSVISPGVVVSSEEPSDIAIGILPKETFYPEISAYAYVLHTKCTLMDLSVISPGTQVEYSKLISLTENLSPSLRNAAYALYLESFALYLELVHLTSTMKLVSRSDITRMCNNIGWLDSSLESLNSNSYELRQVLRDLERTLLYIKDINNIFSATYSDSLQDYSNWTGGI